MGTTRIECIDCGEPRDVPNASKHLVKRCKSCQDEYNRLRALERYYERTGRKPKKKKVKKTEKTADAPKEESKGGWLAGPSDHRSKKGRTHKMSPEEANAFLKKIHEKVFGPGSWDDVETTDDW